MIVLGILKAIGLTFVGTLLGVAIATIAECIYRKYGLGTPSPVIDADIISDTVGDTIGDVQRVSILVDDVGNTSASTMLIMTVIMLFLGVATILVACVLPTFGVIAFTASFCICFYIIFPRIREYQTAIAWIERAVRTTRGDVQDARRISMAIYNDFRMELGEEIERGRINSVIIMLFKQYQLSLTENRMHDESVADFMQILDKHQESTTA